MIGDNSLGLVAALRVPTMRGKGPRRRGWARGVTSESSLSQARPGLTAAPGQERKTLLAHISFSSSLFLSLLSALGVLLFLSPSRVYSRSVSFFPIRFFHAAALSRPYPRPRLLRMTTTALPLFEIHPYVPAVLPIEIFWGLSTPSRSLERFLMPAIFRYSSNISYISGERRSILRNFEILEFGSFHVPGCLMFHLLAVSASLTMSSALISVFWNFGSSTMVGILGPRILQFSRPFIAS